MLLRPAVFLYFIVLSSIINPFKCFAQNVAINNDASLPDPSAMLDIKSTTKGMLVPRMSSAQRTAIVSPMKGLLVFDNNTNGFWYYNGSSWINIAYIGLGWGVTGNSGTDSTINFIGTTDSHSLVFKVNNQNAGVIGFNNTSLGYQSMNFNTTGFENTAMGYQSLGSSSTGVDNTAIGYRSLLTSTGSSNTAVGSKAMFFINSGVEGSFNTAIGASASLNFGGSNNLAAGYLALGNNTSGNSNVAIGSNALRLNSDRSNLVAVGDSALYNNGTGAASSTDATQNTAIGSKALYTNTTGNNNVAMGFQSLYSNIAGVQNTALGSASLFENTIGVGNTAVGNSTLRNSIAGSSNTAIGNDALFINSGSGNTAVGKSTLENNSGSGNTAIGEATMLNNFGNSNVAVGIAAMQFGSNISNIVAVGDSSLFHNGNGAASSTDATHNTAVGSKAMYTNTTGFNNTAMGFQSLYSTTTGDRNTAFGNSALFANTGGGDNTAVGNFALGNNFTGTGNTAVGSGSLFTVNGSNNTGVGYLAIQNSGGSNNTALGFNSLANGNGSNNTALGYSANTGAGAITNSTAIGSNAEVDCSNCMVLGSVNGLNGATSNVKVGIGVSSPTLPLSFPAILEKKISLYPGATGDAGFGVFGNELRINSDYVGADITFGFDDRTNGFTENMRIRGSGNVGIGTNSPSQKLTVNGNICYTGSIGACSDIRYKENITPFSNPLSSVLSMNGFYYNWKKEMFPGMNFSDNRQIGFSAQEVEKLYPEVVMTDANGYKSVDYGRLTPVLVEAIKEQQKEIKELQDEVKMLVKRKKGR